MENVLHIIVYVFNKNIKKMKVGEGGKSEIKWLFFNVCLLFTVYITWLVESNNLVQRWQPVQMWYTDIIYPSLGDRHRNTLQVREHCSQDCFGVSEFFWSVERICNQLHKFLSSILEKLYFIWKHFRLFCTYSAYLKAFFNVWKISCSSRRFLACVKTLQIV